MPCNEKCSYSFNEKNIYIYVFFSNVFYEQSYCQLGKNRTHQSSKRHASTLFTIQMAEKGTFLKITLNYAKTELKGR